MADVTPMPPSPANIGSAPNTATSGSGGVVSEADSTMLIMKQLIDMGIMPKKWDPAQLTAKQEAGVGLQGEVMKLLERTTDADRTLSYNQLRAQQDAIPESVQLEHAKSRSGQVNYLANILGSFEHTGVPVGAYTGMDEMLQIKKQAYESAKMSIRGDEAAQDMRKSAYDQISLDSQTRAQMRLKKQEHDQAMELVALQLDGIMRQAQSGSRAGVSNPRLVSGPAMGGGSRATLDNFHSVYGDR